LDFGFNKGGGYPDIMLISSVIADISSLG